MTTTRPANLKLLRRAAAATAVVALALALWPLGAAGADKPDMQRLEAAFWSCDFAAARYGMDGANAHDCMAVYETWKQARFGGDFDALLEWWRERRDAEHARLEHAVERYVKSK